MPTFVPNGYKLIAVVYTADAGWSGAEGINQTNKQLVTLTYTRGLQILEFTTRQVGPQPREWIDPYSFEGGQNKISTPYAVKGGAYNDLTASLETGFGITPHIWVVGATLVTTINGDVTADELMQMLDSTQRYGEAN